MNLHETKIDKDIANKKLYITREFDATPEQVWRAWTEPGLLDQWWAPKPWKAETKSMDFREGGNWLYAMVGPDNTRHWARIDYTVINRHKRIEYMDAFSDENGNPTQELPSMKWENNFSPTTGGSKVDIVMSFESVEDLEKIIEMGFKEGFAAALTNLDELIETNFKKAQ